MAKRFHFTYLFCNDLESMKHFYSEILHLNLIWEDSTSIAYKIGKHQLSITLDETIEPHVPEFAVQPGWKGGKLSVTSWSIECDKEDFLEIIDSIQKDTVLKVTSANDKPKWVGYWSFPVLDPMNHTIEITCSEKTLDLE